MRIRIDITATPEEMRRLLGLPSLSAQKEDLSEQARKTLESAGASLLATPFLNDGLKGLLRRKGSPSKRGREAG